MSLSFSEPDSDLIRKMLEEENKSLSQMNELYQAELKQKTSALEKSLIDYSSLKTQYEELLRRLTDIQIENKANTSIPSSPNKIVNDLQSELRKRNEKEQVLLKKIRILKQKNRNLQQSSHFNGQTSIIDGLSKAYPLQERHKSNIDLYLNEAVQFLLNQYNQSEKYNDELRRIKNKYSKLKNYYKSFAERVSNNNKLLNIVLEKGNSGSLEETFIQELDRLWKWAKTNKV